MKDSNNDQNELSESFKQVLSEAPPPYALIYRPEVTGEGLVDVLIGDISILDKLSDIPISKASQNTDSPQKSVLAMIPYRQIRERDFDCVDDEEPLITINVTNQDLISLDKLFEILPNSRIHLNQEHFDLDENLYADTAQKIIENEICAGSGANFVLKRSYMAKIEEHDNTKALSLFHRLLKLESGAYWTFIIHTGDRTFVGATPERHISLSQSLITMNPISGTYRYPSTGPTPSGVLEFLSDRKETEELFMVVDEELKMMAKICENGGSIYGPHIKAMSRLAHTEYLIKGRSNHTPQDILRETLFAPTITGSPLENACRVIKKYEPEGRGYYSGVAALIGFDSQHEYVMDSTILIRTADIRNNGDFKLSVGSTLVRHSDPISEAEESKAKTAGLLAAFQSEEDSSKNSANPSNGRNFSTVSPVFLEDNNIQKALKERNKYLSSFWQAEAAIRIQPDPRIAGLRALIIDAEDTFTSMIYHQLRALGLWVTVKKFDEPFDLKEYDITVLGPGPGDPRDLKDPRIAYLTDVIERLLLKRSPFIAVCLSHQILSLKLGLEVIRKNIPNQGIQKKINLFGSNERVGFYNSFAAITTKNPHTHKLFGKIEVSHGIGTGEVNALRGDFFSSMQFHPESVLTQQGIEIWSSRISELMLEDQVVSLDQNVFA